MLQPILALATTSLGIVATTLGTALAQTAAPDVAPWVSAGGSITAVGGLVYVARLLASGQLIAAPVAAREKEASEREKVLERLVDRADERETRLLGLLGEERQRADVFHRLLINRSDADLTTGELRVQKPPDPRGDL